MPCTHNPKLLAIAGIGQMCCKDKPSTTGVLLCGKRLGAGHLHLLRGRVTQEQRPGRAMPDGKKAHLAGCVDPMDDQEDDLGR